MDDVAEHLRLHCPNLLDALAYLLQVAALHRGITKTALLSEMRGPRLWYEHQNRKKRISLGKYQQYRDALCATTARRAALDTKWLAYQTLQTGPASRRRSPIGTSGVRPADQLSATAQAIDIATSLASESTTLRLRRPNARRLAPSNTTPRLPLEASEPRRVITFLIDLGVACTAQAPDATNLFLHMQAPLQHAITEISRVGLNSYEEADLAQSVCALFRFTARLLTSNDQQFWSTFSVLLDSRMSNGAEWMYRLHHELPAQAMADAAVWQFQLHRARHFLNSHLPRIGDFPGPPDLIEDFLSLGSCTMAAYNYLQQSQAIGLAADPSRIPVEVARGRDLIQQIRRRGDADSTRRLLGARATDSERLLTAASSLYRAMANLQLTLALSAGSRDRMSELRLARINIIESYELLLMEQSPWVHGIANTLVTAAAYKFVEGKLPAARDFLARAAGYYRRTSDLLRASMCGDAIAQIAIDPDGVFWPELLFIE